jgi:hypothetical protein
LQCIENPSRPRLRRWDGDFAGRYTREFYALSKRHSGLPCPLPRTAAQKKIKVGMDVWNGVAITESNRLKRSFASRKSLRSESRQMPKFYGFLFSFPWKASNLLLTSNNTSGTRMRAADVGFRRTTMNFQKIFKPLDTNWRPAFERTLLASPRADCRVGYFNLWDGKLRKALFDRPTKLR